MQFMKISDIGRITDYNQEADKEIEGIRKLQLSSGSPMVSFFCGGIRL
jgi:hypothetical protein